MEFTTLIDRLDDLLANSKQVPLSGDVRVDKEAICVIIDQLRGAIPDELKDARWIAKEREEMFAEAKRTGVRMLEEAREERARLLGREEIAKGAEQRANRILDDARRRERELRLGAEDYAADILESLDNYLGRFADAVQRGRHRLVERGTSREAALV